MFFENLASKNRRGRVRTYVVSQGKGGEGWFSTFSFLSSSFEILRGGYETGVQAMRMHLHGSCGQTKPRKCKKFAASGADRRLLWSRHDNQAERRETLHPALDGTAAPSSKLLMRRGRARTRKGWHCEIPGSAMRKQGRKVFRTGRGAKLVGVRLR